MGIGNMTLFDEIKDDILDEDCNPVKYLCHPLPRDPGFLKELPLLQIGVEDARFPSLVIAPRFPVGDFQRLLSIYGYTWSAADNGYHYATENAVQSFFWLVRLESTTPRSLKAYLDKFEMHEFFVYDETVTFRENMDSFGRLLRALTPWRVASDDTVFRRKFTLAVTAGEEEMKQID